MSCETSQFISKTGKDQTQKNYGNQAMVTVDRLKWVIGELEVWSDVVDQVSYRLVITSDLWGVPTELWWPEWMRRRSYILESCEGGDLMLLCSGA